MRIVDSYKLGKKYDRRLRMTDQQRDEIKELHATTSIHELSRMFDASRRTIQFILFPERAEKVAQQRKARCKYIYAKQAENQQAYIEYKASLLAAGVELEMSV